MSSVTEVMANDRLDEIKQTISEYRSLFICARAREFAELADVADELFAEVLRLQKLHDMCRKMHTNEKTVIKNQDTAENG